MLSLENSEPGDGAGSGGAGGALTGAAARRNPLKYGGKMDDRSNYAGKQMMTGPAKRGKTTDVYFQKQHAWVMDVRGRGRPLPSPPLPPKASLAALTPPCPPPGPPAGAPS